MKDYGPVIAPPPGLSPLDRFVYDLIPNRYLHCASTRNFNAMIRKKVAQQIQEFANNLIPKDDELPSTTQTSPNS